MINMTDLTNLILHSPKTVTILAIIVLAYLWYKVCELFTKL